MESCPVTIKAKPDVVSNSGNKRPNKSKKKRCAFDSCRKKLSFTDWACKCDKKFCQKHRSASLHNCSYNWKAGHQGVLSKIMLGGKSIDTKNFVSI